MPNNSDQTQSALVTAVAWGEIPMTPGDPFLPFMTKSRRTKETYEDMPTSALPAMEGFQFGCDPELFVRDDKGRFVSAAGLIPGDKDNPYKVEYGAVQVDGMAAEFNIDPVNNFEDFDRNIKQVLKQLSAMLPKGYSLDAKPAVVFDEDVFNAAPDDAKVLGCQPDFNAWTGGCNPPPMDPENPFLRTASGHIHIGWTEGASITDAQHIMNCRDLVKQLDWYLGGWSIKQDSDPTRRRLYGQAGAMRYKSYGVEYRVLSNFWIMDRSKRMAVWNRLQQAIKDMNEVCMTDRTPQAYVDKLIAAINKTELTDESLKNSFKFPLTTLNRSFLCV